MTNEQVDRVCKVYEGELSHHVCPKCVECALCHLKCMVKKIQEMGQERLEKKFRWLGFIQGVLWCEGVYTIDEMKEHNRDSSNEQD